MHERGHGVCAHVQYPGNSVHGTKRQADNFLCAQMEAKPIFCLMLMKLANGRGFEISPEYNDSARRLAQWYVARPHACSTFGILRESRDTKRFVQVLRFQIWKGSKDCQLVCEMDYSNICSNGGSFQISIVTLQPSSNTLQSDAWISEVSMHSSKRGKVNVSTVYATATLVYRLPSGEGRLCQREANPSRFDPWSENKNKDSEP